MTEQYGPFTGQVWGQDSWFRFAQLWGPSGVVGSPAGSTTSGGLGLTVAGLGLTLAAGRAWCRGAGYELSGATKAFSVPANTNASLSRRDRLVMQRDLAAQTVLPVLKTGTAAATPVAPALTQNETGVWEEPLFSWTTPPNSGTTLTRITDERRWIDPGGDTGARGVIGYGQDNTDVPAANATPQRPSTPINFGVHLVPGRLYQAAHEGRVWSDTSGAIATVFTRICKLTATPASTDPILCGSTAVTTATGSGSRYPTKASDVFTVSAEDDYLISLWVQRTTSTGTVTFTVAPTGRYTQTIEDKGVASSSGPSGISSVPQPI